MPPHQRQQAGQPGAVLYIRQSVTRYKRDTDGKRTPVLDTVSPELQESAGRDYCQRRGLRVVETVTDLNRTGRTLKRRSVQEAFGYIERGQAQVIVVWKWSRLARNRTDFNVTCDYVEAKLAGRIESSTEPVDTSTASGRLNRGMLAEIAAFESDRAGEIWKEIHASRRGRRAADGSPAGVPAQGGPRFGYTHKAGTDVYEPDPITGPILAEMYRRHLAGHGFVSIARWLNEQGVRTLANGAWTRDRVARVLDSGFAAGLLVHGKRTRHPTWTRGAHEALITAEEWEQYRRRRELHTPADPTLTETRYLLSGWLRCGDCGFPMHATRLGVEAGYGYWCSRWAQTRTECRCVTVTRAKAERAVEWFLGELAGEVDEVASRAAKAAKARTTALGQVQQLQRRVDRLDERLTRLTHGWTEELIPDAAYATARDEIQATRSQALAELEEARRRSMTVPSRPTVPPDLPRVWPSMPVAGRRQVLRPLLEQVRVCRPVESRRGARSEVWLVVVSSWGEQFTYRE